MTKEDAINSLLQTLDSVGTSSLSKFTVAEIEGFPSLYEEACKFISLEWAEEDCPMLTVKCRILSKHFPHVDMDWLSLDVKKAGAKFRLLSSIVGSIRSVYVTKIQLEPNPNEENLQAILNEALAELNTELSNEGLT